MSAFIPFRCPRAPRPATQPESLVLRSRVRAGDPQPPCRLWLRELADGTEPAESTPSFHRFRLNADPKKTTIVSVKGYRPISTRYQLTNVSKGEIDFFVTQGAINAEVEKVLRRLAGQKNAIAAFDADIAAHKAQGSGIAEDR